MSKNFSVLIDNGDKNLSRYLKYFDKRFETIDECLESLFELSNGEMLIGAALISFENKWIITIIFDNRNRIKEISPCSYFFFAGESALTLLKTKYKHKVSASGVKVRSMRGIAARPSWLPDVRDERENTPKTSEVKLDNMSYAQAAAVYLINECFDYGKNFTFADGDNLIIKVESKPNRWYTLEEMLNEQAKSCADDLDSFVKFYESEKGVKLEYSWEIKHINCDDNCGDMIVSFKTFH